MTAQSPVPLSMYEAQALESRADEAAEKGDWSQASQLLLLGLQKRKAAAGTTDPGYARVLEPACPNHTCAKTRFPRPKQRYLKPAKF